MSTTEVLSNSDFVAAIGAFLLDPQYSIDLRENVAAVSRIFRDSQVGTDQLILAESRELLKQAQNTEDGERQKALRTKAFHLVKKRKNLKLDALLIAQGICEHHQDLSCLNEAAAIISCQPKYLGQMLKILQEFPAGDKKDSFLRSTATFMSSDLNQALALVDQMQEQQREARTDVLIEHLKEENLERILLELNLPNHIYENAREEFIIFCAQRGRFDLIDQIVSQRSVVNGLAMALTSALKSKDADHAQQIIAHAPETARSDFQRRFDEVFPPSYCILS